jgi:hypothetical protein
MAQRRLGCHSIAASGSFSSSIRAILRLSARRKLHRLAQYKRTLSAHPVAFFRYKSPLSSPCRWQNEAVYEMIGRADILSPFMIAPPRSGGSGLDGKSGRKTANVCDKHAKETTRNTAARFMLFLNHCSTEIAEESSREKAEQQWGLSSSSRETESTTPSFAAAQTMR